jgi:hypothetical protein
MFEPVEGKRKHVQDPDTGVVMFAKGSSDITSIEVFAKFPHGKQIRFSFLLELKYPNRPYVVGDPSNPAIKLLLGDFKRALEAHPGTYEENSNLVRYLLAGLSAINRKWPFCRSPFFYSDLDLYKGREGIFPFSFPSNEEVAAL